MRIAWGSEMGDCRFDLPPRFTVAERRLAGRAVAAWRAADGGAVDGLEASSVIIGHSAAGPVIAGCGAVGAVFGLVPGMALAQRQGLAAELVAACDALALDRQPVPIDTSLAAPGSALVLVRGIVLPLSGVDMAQAVLSWREMLDSGATARLRREFEVAMAEQPILSGRKDPFSADFDG